MIDLTLEEAQLFRLLCGFFGSEQVILKMSLLAVCGGNMPQNINFCDVVPKHYVEEGFEKWAKRIICLFTIIDKNDLPKMVIEFFSGYEDSVDIKEEEHQRFIRPVLEALKIPYLTISRDEFDDLLDPDSSLDFFTLLKAKWIDSGFDPI